MLFLRMKVFICADLFVRLKVANSISAQNNATFIKRSVAKLTYFLRKHAVYKHHKDSVSFGLDVLMGRIQSGITRATVKAP